MVATKRRRSLSERIAQEAQDIAKVDDANIERSQGYLGTQELRNLDTQVPEDPGTEEPKILDTQVPEDLDTLKRPYEQVSPGKEEQKLTETHSSKVEPSESKVKEPTPSAQYALGDLKAKRIHLYTAQIARLKELANEGKDIYGQGLSDSIVTRCALELLFMLDLEIRPNMTEGELWAEINRKCCVRKGT